MKVWVLIDAVILGLCSWDAGCVYYSRLSCQVSPYLGEKPLLPFPWGLGKGKEKVSLGLIPIL